MRPNAPLGTLRAGRYIWGVMEIKIKVHDQWAALLVTFLRSLSYVERVEEQSTTSASSDIKEPSADGWGPVGGVWDEPDFDFAEFRRNAWGRRI